MSEDLSYYKETFEESREAFLALARSTGGELRSHPIKDLSFESLYLPPTSGKKEKLLILTSGIHGIEGYTGSALQRTFLANDFFGLKDPHLGILIIHGINPYGFKHYRRVTENNVDLNRNFDTSDDLFKNENEGYAQLKEFLNTRSSRPTFYLSAVRFIHKYGIEVMRRAILKGQYQFSDGIFFGGKTFEPQVPLIKDIVTGRGEGYEKVLLVDLHTGYGEKGKLHLFGDRSPFIDQKFMDEVFQNLTVEYGQEKDFYVVTGGFTVFMAKLFHQKSKFAGILFEFGTIDSHKTIGSMDSLYRMVNEEKESFKEMFYPDSPEWRSKVMEQFRSSLKQAVKNL